MKLSLVEYPTIEYTEKGKTKSGIVVNVEDIPMLSDERWMQLTNTTEQKALRTRIK